MRYFRLLTNALVGGVLMAAYLVVLVFQLNPQLPVLSVTAVRWAGAVFALYVPALSVGLYILLLGRDLFASRPLRPAWLSVRLLAWLSVVTLGVAALLTWVNLDAFAAVMTDAASDRMRAGAWTTTGATVVVAAIAVFRYSFGRRGSRAAGVLLTIVLVVSVVAPVWLRGSGEPWIRPPLLHDPETAADEAQAMDVVASGRVPRVFLLALDAASLGFIRQRVAAGRLPNLARLLDRGATIDLATLRPTEPEPIWAAVATGKYPQKNGVRSRGLFRVSADDADAVDILPDDCFAYALVNQGFVRAEELSAAALGARPIWDILADYGIVSGVAGWPLTFPARARVGYVVSNRFDDAASSPLRLADADAASPTTAADIARGVFDGWQAKPWRDVLPSLAAADAEPVGLDRARWDRAYHDTAVALAQQFAPELTALRYEALDVFGHRGLAEAQPERFGEPRRADLHRSTLDQYYDAIDRDVGDLAGDLAPGDLLLVVSGYGMEPTPLGKRLLAHLLAEPDLTGTHQQGPDGFLIAYGTNVAAGQFARGAIVDVAPTILYYMGVDVGRDMDGFARTDLFVAPFVAEHPVKYVATHDL
jgi:hypothetical protein